MKIMTNLLKVLGMIIVALAIVVLGRFLWHEFIDGRIDQYIESHAMVLPEGIILVNWESESDGPVESIQQWIKVVGDGMYADTFYVVRTK